MQLAEYLVSLALPLQSLFYGHNHTVQTVARYLNGAFNFFAEDNKVWL